MYIRPYSSSGTATGSASAAVRYPAIPHSLVPNPSSGIIIPHTPAIYGPSTRGLKVVRASYTRDLTYLKSQKYAVCIIFRYNGSDRVSHIQDRFLLFVTPGALYLPTGIFPLSSCHSITLSRAVSFLSSPPSPLCPSPCRCPWSCSCP